LTDAAGVWMTVITPSSSIVWMFGPSLKIKQKYQQSHKCFSNVFVSHNKSLSRSKAHYMINLPLFRIRKLSTKIYNSEKIFPSIHYLCKYLYNHIYRDVQIFQLMSDFWSDRVEGSATPHIN
jgi:hypothetical protein